MCDVSDTLTLALSQLLAEGFYVVKLFQGTGDLLNFLGQGQQHLDCLIVEHSPDLPQLGERLRSHSILLPTIIVGISIEKPSDSPKPPQTTPDETTNLCLQDAGTVWYHTAEVQTSPTQLSQIRSLIDQAISQFLQLSLTSDSQKGNGELACELTTQAFVMTQQQRLAAKLKERLGYLGVYYKRNPENFFRYLSQGQRQELLDQLKMEYRQIVLTYFSRDSSLNQQIDHFVDLAFFSDISVSKVVEIHMELMDEFAKQLKLEGRSEEILLDYRLTLIDVIAHLGEMYRRSIPRES
ncbi:hypothetical protein DO97_07400 [Neosynechococcus sphagnicola sy1]|uniref:Circadian clock oscillator protein KaiA n=1 Tax=Neosynechococcus sphagnicola sy1 TaxID=1497020 RepID=A0A098TJU5_9CYAN|nr:hypothetical protein DO97_07400 [Neosynechococcus sphagnicola sy1]